LGSSDGSPGFGVADGLPAGTDGASSPGPDETALRVRLGVPPEAKQVLVFGETSHWDPSWLHTSEEYYALCIPGILERVMRALEVKLSCPSRPFRTAALCDARERRLRDLEVSGGSVVVPMPYALASVLISF
jgi:hypothetical protein